MHSSTSENDKENRKFLVSNLNNIGHLENVAKIVLNCHGEGSIKGGHKARLLRVKGWRRMTFQTSPYVVVLAEYRIQAY